MERGITSNLEGKCINSSSLKKLKKNIHIGILAHYIHIIIGSAFLAKKFRNHMDKNFYLGHEKNILLSTIK